MKKISVVDSIMGSGKTSWAIQHMKENPGPYLYVTPYLTEIDRIAGNKERKVKAACPGFVKPVDGHSSKSDDLKRLLFDGKNIATTHALFKRLDSFAVETIRDRGYTLIMDEVMEVIQPVQMKDSVETLVENGIIQIVDEDRRVKKVLPGRGALSRYADIRTWAEQDRLVLVNGTLLLWLFPADVFQAFKEVYNLCYLFDGQYQKAYYDMHGLAYDMFSVDGIEVEDGWKEYQLIPYAASQVSPKLAEWIDIYEGPMNQIGEADFSLSHSWFERRKAHPIMQNLGGSIRYYTRKVKGALSADIMWTVPKDCRKKVGLEGFASGFVSRTTRATNDYADRSTLAYCVNVFMRPDIASFFKDGGVDLDEDLYALSEMIQWIWRSRIRKPEPVSVFLPSKRMRGLLKAWLMGEISQEKAA